MAPPSAPFKVLITQGAEQDLEALYDHITKFDNTAQANHVLDRLMEVAQSLSFFPERGSHPKELLTLGIREYRQVFFKPYRVIYRVSGQQVLIHLIMDGRRNMPAVLARRLLGA